MWLALVDDEQLDPLPETLPLYTLEAAPGAKTKTWWTVPTPRVEPNSRPAVDDPTLRTLVACVALPYPQGVEAPRRDAFWKIRAAALGCLWAVCARDDRVAATVAELNAVPHAVAVVSDVHARQELRLRAAGFCALMSDNVELHRFFPDGTPSCVEEGFMSLTRSEHWALADEGCRGIGRRDVVASPCCYKN
jgi:hypothetical protein